MANSSMRRTVACCISALVFWPALTYAEGAGQAVATVDKPVIVTATPPPRNAAAESGRMQAVVSVTGYHPASDRLPVEVVVSGHINGGTEQEVGRFGITPDSAFTVSSSEAQRFGLNLPPSLAAGAPVTFSIRIMPTLGTGEGASVRIGDLEIQ
jgi:hypothetical protein